MASEDDESNTASVTVNLTNEKGKDKKKSKLLTEAKKYRDEIDQRGVIYLLEYHHL